jgi:hypothetical protein
MAIKNDIAHAQRALGLKQSKFASGTVVGRRDTSTGSAYTIRINGTNITANYSGYIPTGSKVVVDVETNALLGPVGSKGKEISA